MKTKSDERVNEENQQLS